MIMICSLPGISAEGKYNLVLAALSVVAINSYVNLEDWLNVVNCWGKVQGICYMLYNWGMIERQEEPEKSIDKPGSILAPETLVERLGGIGREKDRILGALHNKVACWGAGFLDYHFGIVWDGFGRWAVSEKRKGRARFRSYIENKSSH